MKRFERFHASVAAVGMLLLLMASCGGKGASEASVTVTPSSTSTLAVRWEDRALNALLVPLFEPDGALSWATPHELMPCRDGATVRVDGRPVAHGRAVPLWRPMVVSFQLDDCWPLGGSWVGLSGTVEMTIVHDGHRLSAAVRPLGLSATVEGIRVPVRHEFLAQLSLEGAGR